MGSSQYLDLELYAVVLQSESESRRFADVQVMHVWGFLHRVTYDPVNSPEIITAKVEGIATEVPLFADVAHPGWVDRTFKTYLSEPDKTLTLFDIDGNVTQKVEFDNLEGHIKAGQVVGKVYFLQHNEVVCTMDIVAAEDCPAPNMFQAIGVWVDRVKLRFSGKDTVAMTRIYNTLPRIIDKTVA